MHVNFWMNSMYLINVSVLKISKIEKRLNSIVILLNSSEITIVYKRFDRQNELIASGNWHFRNFQIFSQPNVGKLSKKCHSMAVRRTWSTLLKIFKSESLMFILQNTWVPHASSKNAIIIMQVFQNF